MTFTKLVCLIVSHAHHLLHLYLVSPLPLVSFSILIGLSNRILLHCSSNHYWQNNDAEIYLYAVDMFLLFVFFAGRCQSACIWPAPCCVSSVQTITKSALSWLWYCEGNLKFYSLLLLIMEVAAAWLSGLCVGLEISRSSSTLRPPPRFVLSNLVAQ